MKPQESYDTMKAAASALGLSLSTLKKAKAAGCSAFRGSRVYVEDLQSWLKENKDDIVDARSKEDVQIEKLLQEVRKLKILNDQKEKLVVKKSDCLALIDAISRSIDDILMQKLENEYPAAVAGSDIAQARIYGKRLGDSLRLEYQKFKEQWLAL